MNSQYGMPPPTSSYGVPPGPAVGPQMSAQRPAFNGVDSYPPTGPPNVMKPQYAQQGLPPGGIQNGPLSRQTEPQGFVGEFPKHPGATQQGFQRTPMNNMAPGAPPDQLPQQMGGLSLGPGQPPPMQQHPGMRPPGPPQGHPLYHGPSAQNMAPHSDGYPPQAQSILGPPQAGYTMPPRPPLNPNLQPPFAPQVPMAGPNRFAPPGMMPQSSSMQPQPSVNMNIGTPPNSNTPQPSMNIPPGAMTQQQAMNIGGMQPQIPMNMNLGAQPQPGYSLQQNIGMMSQQSGMPQTNGTIGSQPPYMGMPARYPQPSQPGYAPGPGGTPQQPGMAQQNRAPGQMTAQQQLLQQQQQQQQQQGRRLDPDQMPSPIQVIEDDKKSRSGDFYTNTKGQVPPLVTTEFVVHDEGVSSPRFMRSTIYSVPCAPDILKQTAVPFAVNVCPFATVGEKEMPPPISTNLGGTGPVRCNRCKAYMCAFMQFIDGGRRFQCVFCKGTTEVPPEYFAHLDHTGNRMDKFQKPELCLGSYEFLATKEYCRNGQLPKPPAFIFMIEASFSSVKNGMLSFLCQSMKEVLSNLPKEFGATKSEIRVGFVTYNSVIHFYNIKGTLAQPQMMVVPDVNEMFVPLVDGFLVSLEEAEGVIESLMEQIPAMFSDTRETETVLGPVIQAGLEALKASDTCGKLFIFHTSLPIAEAPGKLKNRDDRKLLATEKEKLILTPQNTFYTTLGQECVAAACCVDLFLFANSYIDIATIGQVCRLTGGQVYKYTYFQADIDGHRFYEDLRRDVSKPIAFDAIMRVRTSTGIRPTDFFGNYFMSNTTDVELAAVDCDKAISVEIKYDDKLTEEDGAYLQTAVLYTGCNGQRRLRVHNLALGVCSQMADLYRNCELDTIVNFLAKQALRLLMDQNPRQVKESMVNRAAQILATYRKNCASPSSVGQLILPECMKLLPLYVNCLLKSDALAGGSDMATDDRSHFMFLLNSMDIVDSVGYFYPRLLPLHDLDPESTQLPVALRCSVEKVKENGAYLLENGVFLFLWIGNAVNPEWLQDVFAVQATTRIDPEKPVLLELNTPASKRVRGVIEQVRNERKRCMRLIIVRQADKLEIVFRQFLVEDRTGESGSSYVDFLCHLHKEIRNLLS